MKNLLGVVSIVVPYLLMDTGGGDISLAFPWIAAAGIAVSALGALANSGATQETGKISGKKVIRQAGKFLPAIRKIEAQGAIPAFQQAAATQVARRGLTGTGLGAAIQTAGGGAGELFAIRQALQMAQGIQAANAGFVDNTPIPQSGLSRGLDATGAGLFALQENIDARKALAPPGKP